MVSFVENEARHLSHKPATQDLDRGRCNNSHLTSHNIAQHRTNKKARNIQHQFSNKEQGPPDNRVLHATPGLPQFIPYFRREKKVAGLGGNPTREVVRNRGSKTRNKNRRDETAL